MRCPSALARTARWASPGVQMQISSRSGGNRYRASFYADVDHAIGSRTTSTPIRSPVVPPTDLVPAHEANRASRYHDLNAGVGDSSARSPLVASLRPASGSRDSTVDFPVRPIGLASPTMAAKLARSGSTANRVWTAQHERSADPTRSVRPGPDHGGQRRPSVRHVDHQLARVGGMSKAEWNAAMRDRVFVEVRAGQFAATGTNNGIEAGRARKMSRRWWSRAEAATGRRAFVATRCTAPSPSQPPPAPAAIC